MAKSEYADLTYFMIYGYKLVKNSENQSSISFAEFNFQSSIFNFQYLIGFAEINFRPSSFSAGMPVR